MAPPDRTPANPFGNIGTLQSIGNTLQTITQNIISAVNQLQKLVPALTSGQLTADTLVQTGFIRVTGISVVTPGATGGGLHDCATLADVASTNKVFSIGTSAGYYPVQLVFNDGLAYDADVGEVVTVFYSRT